MAQEAEARYPIIYTISTLREGNTGNSPLTVYSDFPDLLEIKGGGGVDDSQFQ